MLDTGEGAALDAREEAEDTFATRCKGAEDGEGGGGREDVLRGRQQGQERVRVRQRQHGGHGREWKVGRRARQ